MKKTLHMVCPHCKLKAELNIQEEAEMILMRCVSCESAFLYFHGETFTVDESEMEKLKTAEIKEVEGELKIDREEEDEDPGLEVHKIETHPMNSDSENLLNKIEECDKEPQERPE